MFATLSFVCSMCSLLVFACFSELLLGSHSPCSPFLHHLLRRCLCCELLLTVFDFDCCVALAILSFLSAPSVLLLYSVGSVLGIGLFLMPLVVVSLL